MKPARPSLLTRLLGRSLHAWGLAVCPALALGCVSPDLRPADPADAPAPRAAAPDKENRPTPTQADCTAAPSAVRVAQVKPKMLPVDLDTVLHLAEEQNVQIALAREKLNESHAEKDLADLSWLPNIHAGLAFYRHEGGIQNEDGTLQRSSTGALFPGLDVAARFDPRETAYQRINAERKVWQQKGELSRITSETLLEAAETYVDLLTARTSEAILRRTQEYQGEVLKWAEALAKADNAAKVQVETIRAAASGREQVLAQLRQQGDAAAVKLAYQLGLPPDVQLVPIDTALRPIVLADAGQPTEALVTQALQAGPGVRELERMVEVIQNGVDRAGQGRFIPTVELRTLEGPFLAGPGASLSTENRFDLGLQLRWNLSDLWTAKPRQRLAQNRLSQARLSYEDLRGRLAMGVQEAQQTIQSTQTQIRMSGEQVNHACQSYRLSNLRLVERAGGSTGEVMTAIQVLELAHLNSLTAIRSHNKAQVRLMVLLGAAGGVDTPAAPHLEAPACGPGGCGAP
ncbi:MAG: TolC family protein [Planctomycetes bacterium]|nr:TolC family protein [Planctomycetota bacterium]